MTPLGSDLRAGSDERRHGAGETTLSSSVENSEFDRSFLHF